MKRQNVLKLLFLSLILSSCGLIEKFKTPEEPTDSKSAGETASVDSTAANPDDLFSKTMNETKDETALNAGTDAPSNINTEAKSDTKDELKSLEDEFSGNAPKEVATAEATATPAQKPEKQIEKQVKVEESIPQIKEELSPVMAESSNENSGKIMNYEVQKGETLMQIAFKIYGDISKWKDLKQMNGASVSKNSALRAHMKLKYKAPSKEFVWNPEGTPHMIKSGETLGTISNSVYQTPKKWKSIWENNKPLIKNPNVIYAGFTLYTKGGAGMANYVQPESTQKIQAKSERFATKTKEIINEVEEVKVDRAIARAQETARAAEVNADEIDLTKDIQSAPIRNLPGDSTNIQDEIKADEQQTNQLVARKNG